MVQIVRPHFFSSYTNIFLATNFKAGTYTKYPPFEDVAQLNKFLWGKHGYQKAGLRSAKYLAVEDFLLFYTNALEHKNAGFISRALSISSLVPMLQSPHMDLLYEHLQHLLLMTNSL